MTNDTAPRKTISADLADEILDAFYGSPGETVENFTYVDTIEGDQRRWMQGVMIVMSDPDGAFWGLEYDRGLTENQESYYPWRGYSARTDAELVPLYPHTVTTVRYRRTPPD